ncbi:MAG: tryptophan synthase subunit alpha [Campylobacterales bacterium]
MKRLIAYLTAGYPSVDFSVELIGRLAEVGVDGVELGIPFSDPVADGPVIQEVNKRALEGGFKFRDLLEVTRQTQQLPINRYWMGYFNIFYRLGYSNLAVEARGLGVEGFIIPDLPFEEGGQYRGLFPLIPFVAPTDSRERVHKILEGGEGFVYLVGYAGITGADKQEELGEIIEWIREGTELPVYLGFGVNEKNAKEKGRGVDGVIVGTAFVRELLEEKSPAEQMNRIVEKAKRIKEALNS